MGMDSAIESQTIFPSITDKWLQALHLNVDCTCHPNRKICTELLISECVMTVLAKDIIVAFHAFFSLFKEHEYGQRWGYIFLKTHNNLESFILKYDTPKLPKKLTKQMSDHENHTRSSAHYTPLAPDTMIRTDGCGHRIQVDPMRFNPRTFTVTIRNRCSLPTEITGTDVSHPTERRGHHLEAASRGWSNREDNRTERWGKRDIIWIPTWRRLDLELRYS